MKPLTAIVLLFPFLPLAVLGEDDDFGNLTSPAHAYWERPLRDPFSLRIDGIRDGSIALDRSSERAFLLSLLKESP
jgi:hypothetical protein